MSEGNTGALLGATAGGLAAITANLSPVGIVATSALSAYFGSYAFSSAYQSKH